VNHLAFGVTWTITSANQGLRKGRARAVL